MNLYLYSIQSPRFTRIYLLKTKCMKKLFVPLSILLLSLTSIANALELQKWPKLVEATPTTIKVEWEKVDKALGYYLYYGTISWVWVGYQKQYSEFLESTGATIIDLDASKEYYVAVTAVDDAGEEGKYSPETVMKTGGSSNSQSSSSSKLALQTVKVLSSERIELTFSNSINTSTNISREFKLVNSELKNEISIKNSQVNGNKVTLQLSSNLETNKKYDLTVISIQDTNGKSIESWVDGISTFTTPSTFDSLPDLNSAWPEETTQTTPLSDMTSTGQVKDFSGNAGQSIALQELEKNTEVAAETNDKLPKTWPEIFFLLLFSLLIGTSVFYFRKKVS